MGVVPVSVTEPKPCAYGKCPRPRFPPSWRRVSNSLRPSVLGGFGPPCPVGVRCLSGLFLDLYHCVGGSSSYSSSVPDVPCPVSGRVLVVLGGTTRDNHPEDRGGF